MRKLLGIILKVPDSVAQVFGYFCAALVVLMSLLVLFEVFMRYVFHRAPLLADELGGYMLVAITFLGVAYAWRERAHVRVEALVTRLPVKISNWLRLFTTVLALAFTVAVIYGGIAFLERSFEQNRRSDSWLRVPLQWPESTIVVGLFFLALVIAVSIGKAIADIRAGRRIEKGPE